MNISPNFTLEEFTMQDHHSLALVQYDMLQNLAGILEVFRDICGSRIKIRHGIRTLADYLRLKKQGYNPSDTSDHFFGLPVPVEDTKKKKKYGAHYTFSVGAADIEFLDMPTNKAFHILLKNQGKFNAGQLILEKHETFWVHVSNPPSLIYSPEICCTLLKREKYLISMNGGKTYKKVKESALS